MAKKTYFLYTFHSESVDDYRPVTTDIFEKEKLPWWRTGEAADGSYVTLRCYLPYGVKVSDYWPEATDICFVEVDEITYSSRFPKPDWCK